MKRYTIGQRDDPELLEGVGWVHRVEGRFSFRYESIELIERPRVQLLPSVAVTQAPSGTWIVNVWLDVLGRRRLRHVSLLMWLPWKRPTPAPEYGTSEFWSQHQRRDG